MNDLISTVSVEQPLEKPVGVLNSVIINSCAHKQGENKVQLSFKIVCHCLIENKTALQFGPKQSSNSYFNQSTQWHINDSLLGCMFSVTGADVYLILPPV